LAAFFLFLLAEVFLRFFPPPELHEYLGAASPRSGSFVADADFGVAYRSWDNFAADYAARLRDLGELRPTPADPRPIWAFFGNSFVQAPGMLGDHVRDHVFDRRAFYLARNELLCVRLTQARLLLERGFRPERIFFALMPLDVASLGVQPLETVTASEPGALCYRPRLPHWPTRWPCRT